MRPKDIVTGLREALQDLLVPELRAIAVKVEENSKHIQALNERLDRSIQTMEERFSASRQESDQRFLAILQEIKDLRQEMNERFAKVDERFAKVDERFLKVEQQIADLRKDMASVNGKLDLLVSHIVDFKALTQVTVRLDMLEKRVDTLAQRLAERSA